MEGKQWKQLAELASAWAWWQPDNADPWIYWAEAQQQQGHFDEAAGLLDQMPDDHPHTIAALVERSSLLFGPLNRPDEGVKACQRVLKRTCDAVALILDTAEGSRETAAQEPEAATVAA